ncbi:MAG TPA: TonB-dependent receptor [Balneolaceae bacterium]|nr:TonB-dependent receptor [Balneolaceae bacterium]
MKIIILSFSLFLLSTSFSSVAVAQIVVELDSISVSASRITTDISESGKSVSVLTSEDIRKMPATSVDELLRNLPGINMNSRNGFGVQADVGIRGSTYSQVLFMLDNVPLNDPLTGHFNANIPVSMSEIGQIELIRGPASTSFGADAVGGVVHIKTKMYLEREVRTVSSGKNVSRAFADVSIGEHGLTMADASAELQSDSWRFSFSARDKRSDGESFANPAFTEGVSEERNFNTFFEMTSFSAAISNRINQKLSWYLRAGSDYRDFNARYFYTRSIFDESTETIKNRWSLAAVTFDHQNHRLELNTSFRRVNDIFDFNPDISPANEHTTDLFFVNLSHQYNFSEPKSRFKTLKLLSGGQLSNKAINSTDRGDHSNSSGGLYTIGTASWQNGLSLTGSLRLQFHSVGSTNFLPQFSAAYNIRDWTLRTSIGRAVRNGDFTERFVSSEIPNLTPLRNIGNPDLKPEESVTFDFGFDWKPTPLLSISPTYFIRSSDNLIDYSLTPSSAIINADNLIVGEEYFYAQNIANSETQGIEIMASSQLLSINSRSLRLNTGYTYIKTTSDAGTVSRYIANHPSHQVLAGLSYATSFFQLNTESSYRIRSADAAEIVNAFVPESYFVTNVKFSLLPFDNGFRMYTRVMNITDENYQEILGAPMPGRWFMAGIQLSL